MCSDPGPDCGPVGVQQQKARLAATLDQLIRLGHKFGVKQPRVGLLQVIEQGLDVLGEDNLVVEEGSVDADMGQAGGRLHKLGSSGGDRGGWHGGPQQPVGQKELSIVFTDSLGGHGELYVQKYELKKRMSTRVGDADRSIDC